MMLPVPNPKRKANGYSTPMELPKGYHSTKMKIIVRAIIDEIVLNLPYRSDRIPGRIRPKPEPLIPSANKNLVFIDDVLTHSARREDRSQFQN
jgi:hypothetical protein